jgi:hypothetical protein
MNGQFDAELASALLGFNGEAVLYCQGISDTVAQEYAVSYARMLQNRAKGIDFSLPRIPHGLFEPNRNLIRATLDRMSEKYFPLRSAS